MLKTELRFVRKKLKVGKISIFREYEFNLFENLREQSSNLWIFHVKNGKKQNFQNLCVVLDKSFMQILDHIAWEHAKCAKFFTCDATCFLMQECAEYCGFSCIKSLRK